MKGCEIQKVFLTLLIQDNFLLFCFGLLVSSASVFPTTLFLNTFGTQHSMLELRSLGNRFGAPVTPINKGVNEGHWELFEGTLKNKLKMYNLP